MADVGIKRKDEEVKAATSKDSAVIELRVKSETFVRTEGKMEEKKEAKEEKKEEKKTSGRVASLHMHPKKRTTQKRMDPMVPAEALNLVEKEGISGAPRYRGTKSRRHVTLIGREQLAEHAAMAAMTLDELGPGVVRSNIETEDVDLMSMIGKRVKIGTALLHFYAPRDPCWKMDFIQHGLQRLMEDGKQGVLAEVIHSGVVHIGDALEIIETDLLHK